MENRGQRLVSGKRRAVLIAGPTASGKSALALDRARAFGGAVVNTDAMQVYGVLRVLTARPGPTEMAEVPHRLYGTVPPAVRFSTGEWLADVARVIAETAPQPLIFVGGTGLYFDALINGFADVPSVPGKAVAQAEAEVAGLDTAGRWALIRARDPEIAARLKAPDPQRVVRALSVLAATGRSLAHFQDGAQSGLLEDFEVERIVLNPDRNRLAERIAQRFGAMMGSGAVAEVEALLSMRLDARLPAMKAIGVREIGQWQDGALTRDEAVERAVIATRQYAKRQRTWFRSRMADWRWLVPD